MKRPEHQRASLSGAFAAVLLMWASQAAALTLGPARVLSPLGETLNVEVDFESLTSAEAESLRAAVGSPELYRQSGFEYNASLAGARVVLQRAANAPPSLRITGNTAVREPFIELIVEVSWRGGRLARSYTLLFDLPRTRDVNTPAALAPAAPPPAGSVGLGGPGLAPRTTANPDAADLEAPRRRGRAPAPRRGPPPAGAPDAPAQVADPYRVRPGDTLSEVAQRGPRPAGVSLDRLILALYRANQDAFLGGNMNRLRHGQVLEAPTAAAIAATTDAEARQVIRAQSADFNGYRSQLANMPVPQGEASSRRASGRIEAAVEDRKQSTATTPDKLTLTKPQVKPAADPTDQASRERERKDAAARVAELSKNVQDLGRLNGQVAPTQAAPGGASASRPGAASAPSFTLPIERVGPPPVVPPPPMASPPASRPAPSASLPASASLPPSPASVAASAAASATVPPRPNAPPASAAAARPMAKASAPPPVAPAEPDLMESLLEDNLPAVGLAGALIALLAGFGVFRLLKRRRGAPPETSFLESRLKPDSFFGASGGQRVDTREVASTGANSSMMNYSLSQLDAIGDVDPVAEADVYLAYGRDLQAEEILKEAMRTTPERLAIRTKLLEVYAKRRDVKGYEQLALQLQAITGGSGDDWAKAREMGLQIDPENPLYGGSGARSSIETRPVYDEQQALSTLPQAMAADTRGGPASEPPLSSSFDLDLDLDLGMDEATAQATMPLDTDATVMAPRQAPPPQAEPVPAPVAAAPYSPPVEDMLSFSAPSGFGELPPAAAPVPPAPPARPAPASVDPTPFSASAFSLDLDLPAPDALSPGPSMLPPVEGFGAPPTSGVDLDPDSDFDTSDPLVRKMELADEFRQIGDVEGARDLLQEVVDRAEGAVKAKAAAMLASLS